MIWYDMIWYDMIRYDMIWYDIWYDMIWYNMIWYDMIWYGMAWYDIIWKGELSISWTVTCSRASPKLTLIDLLNSSNHTQPYSLILLNVFTMYIRRHWVPLKHQRTQGQGPLFFCFLFQVLVREKQQKAEQIKRTKDLHPNWESWHPEALIPWMLVIVFSILITFSSNCPVRVSRLPILSFASPTAKL